MTARDGPCLTRDTLHLYTQVVGKVRMTSEPSVDHRLDIVTVDDTRRSLALESRPVAEFVLPYEAAATAANWDRLALERRRS